MLTTKPIYVLASLAGGALVAFSLDEAGLSALICKALLSQEASRVELPLSYCSPSALATQGHCSV